jgi:phosphatidylserine decarboxylase
MSLLAPEGYPYVVVAALGGIFAWVFGYAPVAIALWLIGAFSAAFFRNPARSSDAPPASVLAPADGKVLKVVASPPRFAEIGLPQQVSIFMSPANVHVNRAPISGTVTCSEYHAGSKFPAYRDKASELNEHSVVVIAGAAGTVAYKQIAGAVARRVVCDLAESETVERGQRVGIIKFGSRVDLFLPAEAAVAVRPGTRTRAGVTVVARVPLEARR